MNENVIKLVDAIKSGDALATENAFADAMADKLAGKLDDMRVAVAQSMFAQPQVQEEEFSEEADLALIEEHYTEEFDADEITIEEDELADITEKYEGFNKLKGELASKGAKNPAGLAAWIGRRKYGKAKFQKAAATDHKMG
jgi:hypothetical protein